MRSNPPFEPKEIDSSKLGVHYFREVFEPLGPVVLQEACERAVRQNPPTSLTSGTIVGLVVGEADSLDGRAADGARFAKLAMHGHFGPERSHLLRKLAARLVAEAVDPFQQHVVGGAVKLLDICNSLAEDAVFESLDINRDVGQLGQEMIPLDDHGGRPEMAYGTP